MGRPKGSKNKPKTEAVETEPAEEVEDDSGLRCVQCGSPYGDPQKTEWGALRYTCSNPECKAEHFIMEREEVAA